jgi:hypothetical protein
MQDPSAAAALPTQEPYWRGGGWEQAVASWRKASSIRGRNDTGGSEPYQRLIATCEAAVTAPARICGYMSASGSLPVRSAIATASAVCLAA